MDKKQFNFNVDESEMVEHRITIGNIIYVFTAKEIFKTDNNFTYNNFTIWQNKSSIYLRIFNERASRYYDSIKVFKNQYDVIDLYNSSNFHGYNADISSVNYEILNVLMKNILKLDKTDNDFNFVMLCNNYNFSENIVLGRVIAHSENFAKSSENKGSYFYAEEIVELEDSEVERINKLISDSDEDFIKQVGKFNLVKNQITESDYGYRNNTQVYSYDTLQELVEDNIRTLDSYLYKSLIDKRLIEPIIKYI